jgi:hypothetical protein
MENNDTWKAFLATQTLEQLIALRGEFLDRLIPIASFLWNTEPRIGKRKKRLRTLVELVAEKHDCRHFMA